MAIPSHLNNSFYEQNTGAHIIYKRVFRDADRQHLVQDVYLKISTPYGFKFQSKPSTWIAQITYIPACTTWKRKIVLMELQNLTITIQTLLVSYIRLRFQQ